MLAGIRAIKEALDKLKVTYWLDCGTLLFAIRENRPDPTDTDISIFLKDKKTVLSNLETFYEYGLRINNISFHPQYGIYVIHLLYEEHGIDIFIRQESKKHLFTISQHDGEEVFAYHPKKFFTKLDKFMLDGLWHNVPHNPEEYLAYYYGDNWRTPIPTHLWDKLHPACVENEPEEK